MIRFRNKKKLNFFFKVVQKVSSQKWHFSKSSQKLPNIWATFVINLVARPFTNSPIWSHCSNSTSYLRCPRFQVQQKRGLKYWWSQLQWTQVEIQALGRKDEIHCFDLLSNFSKFMDLTEKHRHGALSLKEVRNHVYTLSKLYSACNKKFLFLLWMHQF